MICMQLNVRNYRKVYISQSTIEWKQKMLRTIDNGALFLENAEVES